ncbi:MAG: ABC transporter ATP-binding protein [Acidobacteriota bacterium]|nr:ABC transporter ATP-binding protein [Acidobacteriota bacterium]
MNHAIETLDLGKRYPVPRRYRDLLLRPFSSERRTALEGVSLQLKKGELAGLLGRNGAGKTTLIKILCTLVLPSSGQAFVNGYDVVRDQRAARRSIGFVVSEERSFYWRLTGRQNLGFFATLNNLSGAERDTRIRKVIRLVGLEAHADRMFKDYSSGMKQRLAIARGLLTDPEILFLDEPTKSLDPLIAREVRDLIKGVLVSDQGHSAILATNNLKEAEDLFDHVTILDEGRVLASRPRSEMRALLSGGDNHRIRVRTARGELERLLPSLGVLGFEVEIADSVESGDRHELQITSTAEGLRISELIERMVGAGIEVESCVALEPTLDEIFTRIVERRTRDAA